MQTIAIVICIGIFAWIAILEKLASQDHHYSHIVLVRTIYAMLGITSLIVALHWKQFTALTLKRSLTDGRLALIGLMAAAGMFMYFWLLSGNDLYMVTLMTPLIMILTMICAYVFIGESIAPLQWFGMMITIIGLTIVASNKTTHSTQ